jgi:hypothetical protein
MAEQPRTVREWQPHTQDPLPDIEATIDAWNARTAPERTEPRRLSYEEVAARVDKLTRRVKGSRKVVVEETITEWVDEPSAPAAKPTAKPSKPARKGSGWEPPASKKR